MIVVSEGLLTNVNVGWSPTATYGRLRLYGDHIYEYDQLYRLQPNVRTCVDFLARNVAQLGLHVFRRVSDTDRQRLYDHPLAELLSKPNWSTTRYRLIEAMMGDLGIYFNAYWLKVWREKKLYLVRVSPSIVRVEGGLIPKSYEINLGTERLKSVPEDLVHFRGYNPSNTVTGLSPLETLRRVLAEEQAMGAYREGYWANAARMSGIIERPAEAADWSAPARERFKAEFEALYSGEENSGRTAILEEGMTWKQASFSAKDSEYLAGRKLTREECARAYHIPLPMVGILDNATFSNIKEQHRNLYQDCLGPWLKMIEEDIELQLLPDMEDTAGVYVEFNMAEKLAGSFDEQTTSLQSAIGRPWMTPNEGRARMNLPSLSGDADALATPLNVLIGGQASPRDSAPPKGHGHDHEAKARPGQIDPTLPELRERHIDQWTRMMRHTFERQQAAVMSKVPKKATIVSVDELWDAKRWNEELGADYYRLSRATTLVWAGYMADELEFELDETRMDGWLVERSRIASEEINSHTRGLLAMALTAEIVREALGHVFEVALSQRAPEIACTAVLGSANFGTNEGARQAGLKTKSWQVNSSNPRPEHMAMDGESVPIGDLFSNGMMWPGDPAGGADNNANCQCSVTFGR
ncbi:MAG TPA: phage portal protein [Anaerolineae bacterium]|nr:phage portal protein [Anaerolineae bacterium]